MAKSFKVVIFTLLTCFFCLLSNSVEADKQRGVSSIRSMKKKDCCWVEFGTFDEFKMKGTGHPGDSSVFVKDCGDSIFVKKSSFMDSVIVYRKNCDFWENHLLLDFEKKDKHYLDKSSFDLPPRVHDRYILNDTLVEICTLIWPDNMTIDFYLIVKPSSYDKVYRIDISYRYSKHSYLNESFWCLLLNPQGLNYFRLVEYFRKDPRRVLNVLHNPRFMEATLEVETTCYKVSEDSEFIYYLDSTDDGWIAKKRPYGLFGLQPSFDCFYQRNWTPWDMDEEDEELIEHVHPPSDCQNM